MIIPAGYSQVNLFYTGVGIPRGGQVAFGVQNSGALSPGGVAAAVQSALVTGNWMGPCSSRLTISKIRAKNGPNTTGPFADLAVSIVGGTTYPSDSPQVAVLVKKNTGYGGRTQTGRMFLPGITEGDTDDGGTMTTAAQASWQSVLSASLAALDADGVPMFLLHDGATSPTKVTSLSVERTLASQRRRIRKVGGRRRTP